MNSFEFFTEPKTTVDFTINGAHYTVSKDVSPETSLNVFIREHAKLRGTKAMCHEGGCGLCIVAAEIKGQTMAINSCLVPVFICNGWAIKTIEGIGNKKDGYHSIQATLAEMNGSQCGYCSPGMVMNLYSLLQQDSGKSTMTEIENSFGSNVCRCTGYRPILDAFKGFASDAPRELLERIHDIEEAYKIRKCWPQDACLGCEKACALAKAGPAEPRATERAIEIDLGDSRFHKVLSVDELFAVFANYPNATYILNGGNTAHGVYRSKRSDVHIDVNDIEELRRVAKDASSLVFGGNVTLAVLKETFDSHSKEKGFEYLRHMARHLDLVAGVSIRNIGTVAGNLMIKHQHPEFPSDLFLMLETAGATIHILEAPGRKSSMSLLEFLRLDMRHKIVYSIVLNPLGSEYIYRSYKIMPRAQNAHAHVNAGFLFKINGAGQVLEKPNVIFGGINKDSLHASNTESYLLGKNISDKSVLSEALRTLDSELKPDHVLPDYSPTFRKTLAEGLFYKFVLAVRPDNLEPRLRSGATLLERGLSSGSHDYDTDKNLWPLNKPIPKIEAIYQTSGEAQYVNDIPPFPAEVFCAFVLSNVANRKIQSIDPKEALGTEGVIAFYGAKDVPGKNAFIPASSKHPFLSADELLFAEEDVQFAGQALGVIAARTHLLANEAASKVKVTYVEPTPTDRGKPVLTIDDVLASKDAARLLQTVDVQAPRKGADTKHVIKGEFQCGSQYHYTMEPQSCVCVPVEDGIDVYPASQYVDLVQVAIAECLNVRNNSVNVKVRRLGGGYGAKISRATQLACACALVSYRLNRPARFAMSIESNMQAIGKRYSTRQEYEVGVDENGLIQYVNSKHWGNCGASFNEVHAPLVAHHMTSCYDPTTWSIQGFEARTDIPSNTYCRAPGSTEGIGMTEHMMEHISRVLGKDPLQIRMLNMNEDDKRSLQPMIEELTNLADYESRKRSVENFNNENRWKKRGISLVPMKYPFVFWGQFNAMVSVYARDGTVSITHGGIECGQGVNTKVCQVAAHTLGIDLSLVAVKPTDNFTAPNNSVTGGSVTSESCSYATMMACKEILRRLEPIKLELKDPSWQELVMSAYAKDVDLCARYMFTPKDDVKPYGIYGVAVAEVEVDILTGQHVIHRVDLMEDAGISLSPEIDLGQVEGSFVMGIGYWTSEDLIYDPDTGRLTNDRTWNYKPPGAKDIPIDFRVTFRRNAPNPVGVLRSKATGEPPLCMSCVIPLAIRNALNSARADSGNEDAWYRLDGPLTTQSILLNTLTTNKQMVL